MIGFIGLGVMGEPICRNLAKKSAEKVLAFDLKQAPLARLKADGVEPASSVRELAERCHMVFLSLPGVTEVKTVCAGPGSLMLHMHSGGYVVDLSTTTVALARDLHSRFTARGIYFADAPVARTRSAAEKGTLLTMVGSTEPVFKRLRPCLAHFATDIAHCGATGAGQATKLINNLVLFQNVVALAEALALVGHSGIDPVLAFEVLSKGSADSFALRNHGMKAMLKGAYPERAYSSEYALKDIRYVLRLAEEAGLFLNGADNAKEVIKKSIRAGYGKEYFPALAKTIVAKKKA